ncbi:MAG TPA: glycosyltransferase, partial [Gaiella sp.]
MSLGIVHVAKVAGISGSENHLLLLLPDLHARGHDVRLVMLHEGEPGAEELAGQLEREGVPVERLRMRLALDPLAFARVARSIRRRRPDVVHTHLVHADFHGLPAGRLARVPLAVSMKHGFNPFRGGRAFSVA